MFTLQAIDEIHGRLGNRETLPAYLQALHDLGITSYDSYIHDGHSEYFEAAGRSISSSPIHEALTVAAAADQQRFLDCLDLSQQGEIGYLEMSKILADSGVAKWTFDTVKRTITYYDAQGAVMLSETVE